MVIFNTLTKKKEPLEAEDGRLKMFVCGPTPYDYIHIGNARTFVVFDVVAKYLRHKGLDVTYIQNITDIDDKIIRKAQEARQDALGFSEEYTDEFLIDMQELGVTAVSRYARATEHIPQVIAQVKTLIEKGHAYLIEGDGYYFDLTTFPDYGKLAGRTTEMAEDGVSRIDVSDKKRNRGDFCLWKFSKSGEPAWPFDDGLASPAEALAKAGRPGWHIEDTAITEHYFGPQYDLHGGGQDLMFPHHEAEIAQQESASGQKPFVRYWMHNAFLVNKEQKMSKSLGNFDTVHDLLEKYTPEALRFYLLSAHYRSPLDYNDKILDAAVAATERLGEFKQKLHAIKTEDSAHEDNDRLEKVHTDFEVAMEDDFNTAAAFGVIFEYLKEINPLLTQGNLGKQQATKILELLDHVQDILGIIPSSPATIPTDIQKLTTKREEARKARDFDLADKLRDQLVILGYSIEDTAYGPLLKKIK